MRNEATSAAQKLQDLREKFREQLPVRIRALESGLSSLISEGWTVAAATQLRFLTHSLTGSAGTFGYASVSSAARVLERELDSLLESADPPVAEHLSGIAVIFERLEKIAATERQQNLISPSTTVSVMRGLIYLADEDRNFSADLSGQLGNFGYEVREFPDQEALDKAIKQQYPAAILFGLDADLRGASISRQWITALSGSVPFVFISKDADFVTRLSAARIGCSGFFKKQFDIGALVDCLDRLTKFRLEKPYRVLVVDDSILDADAYAVNLRHAGFEVAVVNAPFSVMERLAEFMPDLILMDVNMPECSGVELAMVIRQQDAYHGIPIVFLSAETDRDHQLLALKQGGDDFLIKPIQYEHLVNAVHARAERGRMLCSLMMHDSLTGLLNHNRIKEQMIVEIARADRSGSDLSVAMIDIDYFKKVNDTHGHPVGDRVIKSLSRLLQQRLRLTDAIGRYGGEEFVVILSGTTAVQAQQIMDDIRKSFSKVRHHATSGDFSSTFSCGIASFPDCGSPSRLLEAADHALYEAKLAGRDRVIINGQESAAGAARQLVAHVSDMPA